MAEGGGGEDLVSVPERDARSQEGSTDSLPERVVAANDRPVDTQGQSLEYSDSPVCEPSEQPGLSPASANCVAPQQNSYVTGVPDSVSATSTSEMRVTCTPGQTAALTHEHEHGYSNIASRDAITRRCPIARVSSDPVAPTRRNIRSQPHALARSASQAGTVSVPEPRVSWAEVPRLEQARGPEDTTEEPAAAPAPEFLTLQSLGAAAEDKAVTVVAWTASEQRLVSDPEPNASKECTDPTQMPDHWQPSASAPPSTTNMAEENSSEANSEDRPEPVLKPEAGDGAAASLKLSPCEANRVATDAAAINTVALVLRVEQQTHPALDRPTSHGKQEQREPEERLASLPSDDGATASAARDDAVSNTPGSAADGSASLQQKQVQEQQQEPVVEQQIKMLQEQSTSVQPTLAESTAPQSGNGTNASTAISHHLHHDNNDEEQQPTSIQDESAEASPRCPIVHQAEQPATPANQVSFAGSAISIAQTESMQVSGDSSISLYWRHSVNAAKRGSSREAVANSGGGAGRAQGRGRRLKLRLSKWLCCGCIREDRGGGAR